MDAISMVDCLHHTLAGGRIKPHACSVCSSRMVNSAGAFQGAVSGAASTLCIGHGVGAENHALSEALEDASADEAMPAPFYDHMLDIESPIRVWREFRGLKARELAEAASGLTSSPCTESWSGTTMEIRR